MYNVFIPSDGVDIITKKKLFDQLMLVSWLTEEKQILVKEMMQHCQYLKDSAEKVQSLMATVSVCTQTASKSNYLALCILTFIGQTIFKWKAIMPVLTQKLRINSLQRLF